MSLMKPFWLHWNLQSPRRAGSVSSFNRLKYPTLFRHHDEKEQQENTTTLKSTTTNINFEPRVKETQNDQD